MEELVKKAMPSKEEVLAYGKPLIRMFIAKECPDLPREQKDEIIQESVVRLLVAYPGIDPDKGWKSYVYTHCFGCVKDYLKAGDGFEEASWSLQKEEEHDAVHVHKVRHRAELHNSDGESIDVEQVLGNAGKFAESTIDIPKINWDQLRRMARTDEPLHIFLRHILGQQLEEIAEVWGQSRSRVGQLLQEFIDRFDDPELANDPWMDQVIWALGLANHFDLEDSDQSTFRGIPLGQSYEPIDLEDMTPAPAPMQQIGLFGEAG